MEKFFTLDLSHQRKFSLQLLFLSSLLIIPGKLFSQCDILTDAVQGISYTYVGTDGTNASGVAYNPNFNLYYAVIAGNAIFPYETFDLSGTSLNQTNAGFDFRGLWWNPNTNEVEGNGYFTFGLWTSNLDVNGYALNTGTNLFIGQNQPTDQSCGDYDYDANEIIYFYNGSIYRYDRTTDAFLGSYALTGMPVPLSDINSTSVIYTGCCGNEIGVEDYVNKAILLFNKTTGAYSGTSQLPSSAITNSVFRLSYANDLAWLYDAYTRTWNSYSILSGSSGNSVNIGNDTALCVGSSLVLSAGSSSYEYLWSNGSTDSTITVDTAGTYWLQVTNGSCVRSDTIIISDTLCAPLISFNSTDTSICEKFCISFFDSSQNNPIAWQWFFEGASPSSSTQQNPTNICYNDPGSYDVTLITTNANGNDTLTLSNYITVNNTPAFPTISQNGYELTVSAAAAYQWQLNLTDIPGATNQTYSVLQTGLYTVIVYDENGCKNSASLYVQIVGIDEVNADASVAIYPNPATENLIVEFLNGWKSEAVSISMMNAIGQEVFSFEQSLTYEGQKKEITLANISDGVYFITIRTQDELVVKKITVAK